MSSPITFSGFNNIDFSTVLKALMQQESVPLDTLIAHQSGLKAENSSYGVLATRLSALDSAASALGTSSTVTKYSALSGNPTALGAAAGDGVVAGRYDVVVGALARAQVTVSNTTSADADTTTIAAGDEVTVRGTWSSASQTLSVAPPASRNNVVVDFGVPRSPGHDGF